MPSHVWDGYWILGNSAAFKTLPADIQAIALKEFNQSVLAERQASSELSNSLQAKMGAAGLTFIDVDKPKFRAALSASGFYATWKQKFGNQAGDLLEQTVGQLT